jgi:hypothetical protein
VERHPAIFPGRHGPIGEVQELAFPVGQCVKAAVILAKQQVHYNLAFAASGLYSAYPDSVPFSSSVWTAGKITWGKKLTQKGIVFLLYGIL